MLYGCFRNLHRPAFKERDIYIYRFANRSMLGSQIFFFLYRIKRIAHLERVSSRSELVLMVSLFLFFFPPTTGLPRSRGSGKVTTIFRRGFGGSSTISNPSKRATRVGASRRMQHRD